MKTEAMKTHKTLDAQFWSRVHGATLLARARMQNSVFPPSEVQRQFRMEMTAIATDYGLTIDDLVARGLIQDDTTTTTAGCRKGGHRYVRANKA